MNTLDALVAAAIGGMAAWPFIVKLASPLLVHTPKTAPAAGPKAGDTEAWRQSWASTLISLLDQIEAGQGHFADDKTALRLAKELLWEIIGGDGAPSKAK